MALLELHDLRTAFRRGGVEVEVVRGVSLQVEAGETLAIVGESGSGKSVTALSILRLLMPSSGRSSGRILFKGTDLLSATQAEMRRLRGDAISMVFQDPMSSLNPVFTVGQQIAEAITLHTRLSRGAAWRRARDLLGLVGIPAPERRVLDYPHQFSGGMRQRVTIAMALACDPALLIADEPTTALDVTVQAQILALIRDLQQRLGSGVILITHDFGVVAELADRVAVMYGGRIVEEADVTTLFRNAQHPYTRGLLAAMPRLGRLAAMPRLDRAARQTRLAEIPGTAPASGTTGPGCAFAPRCAFARPVCEAADPAFAVGPSGQKVACHFVEPGRLA
jgi:peptide/nickel transport system ATP-binding protein